MTFPIRQPGGTKSRQQLPAPLLLCAPPRHSHPSPPSHLRCGLQVGQKRGRSQLEELNAEVLDGAKRKKVRLGFPASQWVTVYNKHAPMKQR